MKLIAGEKFIFGSFSIDVFFIGSHKFTMNISQGSWPWFLHQTSISAICQKKWGPRVQKFMMLNVSPFYSVG